MMRFNRTLVSAASVGLVACAAVDNDSVGPTNPDAFMAQTTAALEAPDPPAAMLALIFTEGMTEWEADLAQSTAGRLAGQEGVTNVLLEPLPEDFDGVNVRDGVEYAAVPDPQGYLVFEREGSGTSRIPYGIVDGRYWIIGTRRTVVDPDAPRDKTLQIMAMGIANPPAEFDGWCDVRRSNAEIDRVRIDDLNRGNQTTIVAGQEIVACELTNVGGRGSLMLRLLADDDVIFEGHAELPETVVRYEAPEAEASP